MSRRFKPLKKKTFRFKAKVPDLNKFIGRTVVIDGKSIKIEKIVGNLGMSLGREHEKIKPMFYEINGAHLINMLRFHAQMEGATDITEEQFLEFENLEFAAERMPEKPIAGLADYPSLSDGVLLPEKWN